MSRPLVYHVANVGHWNLTQFNGIDFVNFTYEYINSIIQSDIEIMM